MNSVIGQQFYETTSYIPVLIFYETPATEHSSLSENQTIISNKTSSFNALRNKLHVSDLLEGERSIIFQLKMNLC